jgi:hypothetical protein
MIAFAQYANGQAQTERDEIQTMREELHEKIRERFGDNPGLPAEPDR